MMILKRLLTVLLLAFVLFIGVLFAIQNRHPIPLDLLIIQLSEQSLALWLLLAFIVGGLCGIAASVFMVATKQRKIIAMRWQLKKMQREQPSNEHL